MSNTLKTSILISGWKTPHVLSFNLLGMSPVLINSPSTYFKTIVTINTGVDKTKEFITYWQTEATANPACKRLTAYS